jgi:hypothetical protein
MLKNAAELTNAAQRRRKTAAVIAELEATSVRVGAAAPVPRPSLTRGMANHRVRSAVEASVPSDVPRLYVIKSEIDPVRFNEEGRHCYRHETPPGRRLRASASRRCPSRDRATSCIGDRAVRVPCRLYGSGRWISDRSALPTALRSKHRVEVAQLHAPIDLPALIGGVVLVWVVRPPDAFLFCNLCAIRGAISSLRLAPLLWIRLRPCTGASTRLFSMCFAIGLVRRDCSRTAFSRHRGVPVYREGPRRRKSSHGHAALFAYSR